MTKKVTVYFTRHGETLFNVLKRTQGWCDSPLTEKGIMQAKDLGEGISKIKFSKIYTSTSERSIDTAIHIFGEKECSVYPKKNFRECNFGVSEGQDESWMQKEDFIKRNNECDVMYQGETEKMVADRIENQVKEIVDDANHGDNLFVVTHGLCLVRYLCRVLKTTFSELVESEGIDGKGKMGNCAISIVEYTEGVPHIIAWGDTTYSKKCLNRLEVESDNIKRKLTFESVNDTK